MSRYIIGDLHGCYASFVQLLQDIDFDETKDKVYLCGDIVARGQHSLATLRLVKYLADKGALQTVLGNHDMTLIATWLGVLAPKPKDKTSQIFEASDCDELLEWLRRQPFLLEVDLPTNEAVGRQGLIVHAGIPPNWTTQAAKLYAKELEQFVSGDKKQLSKTLTKLYSKKPEVWTQSLRGTKRLKAICDYLTRMRLCTKNGVLEFDFKEDLAQGMPTGFLPWFEWQVDRDERIFFGHWAALMASIDTAWVRALDGGCVWGGKLIAYRIEDNRVFETDLLTLP